MTISNKTRSTFGVKHVIVRAHPREQTRCLIRVGNVTLNGSWGRGGRTIQKFEGDGKTPIATMHVLYGFYKNDRKQKIATHIAMEQATPNMGWCDASANANYNKRVRKPFSPSHENLIRDDILYDYVIVLDWNITRRQRNRGSAIFFHVAKPGYKPTEGCIAISKRDMVRLLPYLTRQTKVTVL